MMQRNARATAFRVSAAGSLLLRQSAALNILSPIQETGATRRRGESLGRSSLLPGRKMGDLASADTPSYRWLCRADRECEQKPTAL